MCLSAVFTVEFEEKTSIKPVARKPLVSANA
jgi:hypothetical protein